MTYVYKGLGLLCPCVYTSYKMHMVSNYNPVDYANACNQLSVFIAPSQGKSNLLWLLAETLEPLLIYIWHADASSSVYTKV